VWVGRKIHARHLTSGRHKRILAITGGVTASLIVSPLLAGLAVSIGVPILLAYVYGVVPISLCRSGGCGVRTTTQGGVRIDIDEEAAYGKGSGGGGGGAGGAHGAASDLVGGGGSSRVANPSIGEVSLGASLSLGSGSHLDRYRR
jgi:E3 ubiquitin-protein ligase RNF19A